MIRIGFVRWLIKANLIPRNGGQTEISLSLVPQGRTYRALVKVWHGLRDSLVEQDVHVNPISVSRIEQTYDLKPAKMVKLAQELAAELASSAIQYSTRVGLVDFADHNLIAVNYLVRTALMRAVETGNSDEIERVEFIDLAANMREVMAERQRAAEEAIRQHEVDQIARRAAQEQAVQVSLDLLYSMLNPTELAEAKNTGKVTIKNFMGEFIVPITSHGLVKHYADGKYQASYCIVFADYSIPMGDEALMKVCLLKGDLNTFLKTANKFDESRGMLRIA